MTNTFPDINGCTVEFWEKVSNFMSHFIARYLLRTYPHLV